MLNTPYLCQSGDDLFSYNTAPTGQTRDNWVFQSMGWETHGYYFADPRGSGPHYDFSFFCGFRAFCDPQFAAANPSVPICEDQIINLCLIIIWLDKTSALRASYSPIPLISTKTTGLRPYMSGFDQIDFGFHKIDFCLHLSCSNKSPSVPI